MHPIRDFIRIKGRWVHYQSWGDGPVILALHGSPQSSRTMAYFAEAMASAGFRVIAPDTAGNGYSEPLPCAERADTTHYAHALEELVEALGLETFGLYGFHTGAAIACTYAALYPERVSALLFDGLPQWSAAEDEALAGYLKAFLPSWDGAHMAWLWARMEEQAVFFPWHKPTLPHRMDYDVSSKARCHANVMDMLHAGNHYAGPYRTALTFRPEAWVDRLKCEYYCTAQWDDVLTEHLSRGTLKDKPQRVFESPEEMLRFATALFDAHRSEMKPAPNDPIQRDQGGETRGCVTVDGHDMVWTLSAPLRDNAAPVLLLVHPAGDNSSYFAPLVSRLAHTRRVLTIDLPGHGLSTTTAPDRSDEPVETVEELARLLAETCRRVGVDNYVVAGRGLGGQIAAAMLAQGHVSAAASIGAAVYTDAEREDFANAPNSSLVPEWDGTHLLRAWRIARWEKLFFPWYKRDRQHALPGPYSLDEADIHRRAVALLTAGRHGDAAKKAEMAFDLIGALSPNANFRVYAIPGDPLSTTERTASLQHGGVLPSGYTSTWADRLEDFGK